MFDLTSQVNITAVLLLPIWKRGNKGRKLHAHLFMCVVFGGNAGGFTCCLGLHAELKIISHSIVHCFHGAAATFPIIPHGKSLDWHGAVGPVITTHPQGARADLEQLTAHSFHLIRYS